ncbi:MAG: hypothetical protein JW863_14695 [Chitinispirillaceae bacterium]|nr:hypothetical protein [Chitinispirillaceae bacterium]
MKRATLCSIVAAMMSVVWYIHCSPVSTQPDTGEGPALLQLSLEETGRSVAEFSGAPIPATVMLDRDTLFNVLTWHTGAGYPLYSDTVLNTKARKFTVELYWTTYPRYKDTTDNIYYDTVWVSIGGGLKKSNKVRIKVTNLPIVVDSARFDTIAFLGQDTVWQCSLPQMVQPSYPFTIFARDLDNKQPMIQVLGNKGTITHDGTNPLEMEYLLPEGDFCDTIDFIIFDQQRGQAFRTLVVNHTTPNRRPVIDSVQVRSTMLNASSMVNGVYRVAFFSFDTLKLRVFAHDTLGSVKGYEWSALSNSIEIDSTAGYRATYVCGDADCTDTLRDSSVSVDVITVKVYDNRGDSAVRKIELLKGEINQPPKIGSLLIGDDEVSFTDTSAKVTVAGGKSYLVAVECSDPENDEVSVTWTGSPTSRFSGKTDSTILYTAPSTIGTDTLRIKVSDGETAIVRRLLFAVTDILPRFDSLTVADTVFTGIDSVFSLEVVPGDTLLCIGYATDPDTGDAMSYGWSSEGDGSYYVRIENRARYILPDPLVKDTIILTIQDGEAQLVRRVICAPANRAPVIDSITGDDLRLTGNAAFLNDTAAPADTVVFAAFGHDPEEASLSWLWNASDTTLLGSRTASFINYYCRNSNYIDTVSVTLEDEKGAVAVRKIILTVIKTK